MESPAISEPQEARKVPWKLALTWGWDLKNIEPPTEDCTLARVHGQEELPKGRIWNIPVGADGQDHLLDRLWSGGNIGESRLTTEWVPAPVGRSSRTLETHESWLQRQYWIEPHEGVGPAVFVGGFPCFPEG